jgi:ABC-2 type transport system permease protein
MKQLVYKFKDYLNIRLGILRASIVYAFKMESAYRLEYVFQFIGTITYLATSLLFLNITYSNVETIAGYNKDQMYLFLLMTQFSLFLNTSISFDNLWDLVKDINNGDLDLTLTKPLPTLFYVSWKNIHPSALVANSLSSIVTIFLTINFNELDITLLNFLIGLTISFLGVLCTHVFQFVCAITAFWVGESRNILDMTWSFEYNIGRVIPYEGFGDKAKLFFTTIIPVLISVGISTSVILSKSDALQMLFYTLLVTTILFFIKNKVWNFALKHYTSASS